MENFGNIHLSRTPGSDSMEDTRQPCSTASASCQYELQDLFPNRTGDRTCTRCESFQCSSRRHSHAASFQIPQKFLSAIDPERERDITIYAKTCLTANA